MSTSTASSRSDLGTTSSLCSEQTPSFQKSPLERYKTEVSLDDFIDTFVPGLPENLEISLVLQHMLNFKTWKGSYSYHENDVFKQLFDEMVNTAQFVWEETCPEQRWSLITGTAPNALVPEITFPIRPDAFLYRTVKRHSDSQSYSCFHVAFAAEFKRSANSYYNTSNIVEAMQYIMAIDARRRFVFGIYLKNASLRLWYANRSILVCSKPLDIVKDKERCLRVLLSFAFASDVDMGLDPSVELVESTEGSFYCINVNDERYKTLAILQDPSRRPDALLGRGARIFKVKRVGDPEDQIRVLKDLWLEKSRKPEHQIYEEIVEDVGRLYSKKGADSMKQHLLTPVDNAIVKINGIEDDTGTSMLRRHTLESSSNDAQPPIRLPSHDATRCGNADMEVDTVDDIRYNALDPEKNCRRLHYRVVFKEYATPISRVRMMADVFVVLADLMKVFRLLHGSGWVHRDISTGNVYLYEGRGLLGDFEFAQNVADRSQPEVRTGTINFMAGEVMEMEFDFRPFTGKEWDPTLDIDQLSEKFNEEIPVLHLPFCYNAIHDIDSAWWVGVWMLFFHLPKGHTESSEISSERRRQTDRVFPGTLAYPIRLMILEEPNTFVKIVRRWIEREFSPAATVFNNVLRLLVKLYHTVEETFPDGLGKLSEKAQPRRDGYQVAFPGGPEEDIYKPIQDAFLAAKDMYEPRKTEIVRVPTRGRN